MSSRPASACSSKTTRAGATSFAHRGRRARRRLPLQGRAAAWPPIPASSSDRLLSPSLGLAFGPWKQTDFYVNLGNGFHSNDARGTLTTIDPRSGEAADKVPGLVRSHGMELGVRTEIVPNLQTSLSLYRLDFDSELTFVGDAGTTEAGRPSRRHGIEFSNYYKPLKWLSIDFDVGLRARPFARFRAGGRPHSRRGRRRRPARR